MKDLEANSILLTAPHDPVLWAQAEATHGGDSLKAMQDEYNRLILAKYRPAPPENAGPPRRGFLSWLFEG